MPLRELLLNVRLYYPHNLLATPPPPTHNKKRKKKKGKRKTIYILENRFTNFGSLFVLRGIYSFYLNLMPKMVQCGHGRSPAVIDLSLIFTLLNLR